MIDSADILIHAATLIAGSSNPYSEVDVRRAVSAAYYALFHRLSEDAANLLAPNVSLSAKHKIRRWFDHGEMKRVCGRFVPNKLDQPLLSLIGNSASEDLQFVARSFIKLQDARHMADYDLSFDFQWRDGWQYVEQGSRALSAWERLQGSAEANIFILSLLMWKNWEKDRASI